MTETASSVIRAVGLGEIDGNSHPVHPVTVHFPIAFLTTAYGLDIAYGLIASAKKSSFLMGLTPYLKDISRVSHFSNIAGILTAIPSAATGSVELYYMLKNNGIWEKITRESDGEVVYQGMNPKARHGIPHGILNDVAIGVSLYQWWTRRGRVNFVPNRTNIILSAIMFPSLAFSAYLGGALVYKYGVGVMRMGEAKQIKEDMAKDEDKGFDGWTKLKVRRGQ